MVFFRSLTDVSTSYLAENAQNKAKLLALFTSIIVVNNIIYLTPSFGVEYYGALLIILFCVIGYSGQIKFSNSMFILYFSCVASLVFNNVPDFFKAEYRLISFVLISSLVSSAIFSKFLSVYRILLFRNILIGCVAITLFSFIGRFIGFSHSHRHYWCGITTHSMILGPISGISAIASFWFLIFYSDNRSSKIFSLISLIFSVLCVMGAGSRTAFIACFIGIYIVLIKNVRRENFKIMMFISFVFIVLFSVRFFHSAFENIDRKNHGSTMLNLSSRSSHWEQRWREFIDNPVFGIGFGTVKTEVSSGSTFNLASGQVETGSSWLSLLSMMGSFGALAMALLLFETFKCLKSIQNKSVSCLLEAVLIFMCVCMCAEGYIWSAGGFLFFTTWLTFGCIKSYVNCERLVSNGKKSIIQG